MKLLILFPLILTSAGFVLSLLSLLAGYKQDFLEDYNLLTLNTSALGQQAVRDIASGQLPIPTSTSGDGSEIGSIIASLPPAVVSAASGILGEIGSQVANQLADELGISEFYSIHAMDFCEGNFEPNATQVGAAQNVTNCTQPLDFGPYNLTDKINQQLSLGPLNFTLAELGVNQDIQDALDLLPKLAKALAAVFIAGVALAGLSMLGSALGFFLIPRAGRRLALLNWLLALLAAILLLASSLIATIGPRVATNLLKENGADVIGLGIISNSKLLSITWAAFGCLAVASFYWFFELIVECVRRRRMGQQSKKTRTSSYEK